LEQRDAFVMEVPSDPTAIDRAVDYVLAQCAHCGLDARQLRLNLRVGLSEALANAMRYGNGNDPSKRVRLEARLSLLQIEVRVTDQGEGFNPAHVPDPTAPDNLQRPCGRGLFLMQKLLDEVRYNDRGNSVTLVLRARNASYGAPQ